MLAYEGVLDRQPLQKERVIYKEWLSRQPLEVERRDYAQPTLYCRTGWFIFVLGGRNRRRQRENISPNTCGSRRSGEWWTAVIGDILARTQWQLAVRRVIWKSSSGLSQDPMTTYPYSTFQIAYMVESKRTRSRPRSASTIRVHPIQSWVTGMNPRSTESTTGSSTL